MKDYIIEFKLTGECPINVDSVVKQWSYKCSIKQYHEEYTLMEESWRAGKRLGKWSKIRISKAQAHELIGKLNLIDEQSSTFRYARMWRTAASEAEMMLVGQNEWKLRKLKTLVKNHEALR